MSWDTIAPIIKQIQARSGLMGRKAGVRPAPNGALAQMGMQRQLLDLRARAEEAHGQQQAGIQAQAQQQAELEALRSQAAAYQKSQAVPMATDPALATPPSYSPVPTGGGSPIETPITPPVYTTPVMPPAATGQPGVVGMTLVQPNGQGLTPDMLARLEAARAQSQAIAAMAGRTDNFGAITPETQQRLDAIRAQAAAINAMYAPAAQNFTKGATIAPNGTVSLSGDKAPGPGITTKPPGSATVPPNPAGIDYSHYRGMSPMDVYRLHANGLPPEWDWGEFARVNGVVDPRTVDAAGRSVNYSAFGPQYQWGPPAVTTPTTSNPATNPMNGIAPVGNFGAPSIFAHTVAPNPMNGVAPVGTFGSTGVPAWKPPPTDSIFHKPSGVGATASGDPWGTGLTWGHQGGGAGGSPVDDPTAKYQPFTFGY